jgi:oligoribonuclease NrnB/cAMP/cGMP phosphodiesterase (DHH superfamily)
MRILVIADTDLDGTGAATIITKYHEICSRPSKLTPWASNRDTVEVHFPSREQLNEEFADEDWVRHVEGKYDLIYLCDTGLNTKAGNVNLGTILAPKTIYFDHHETNLNNQKEYASDYKGFHVVEGERCTAKIAFDVLHGRLASGPKGEEFRKLKKFAGLINDLDLWYRMFPRSTELGDYVAMVGSEAAYPKLLKIAADPDRNVDDMEEVLSRVSREKESSLALAKATLVKHKGYKTPFHTCFVDDWASWVSGEICPKTGMLTMLDVRRKTLSFRVGSKYIGTEWHDAKEPKPNCIDIAGPLGGGGHPQAAGVSTTESRAIFKKLSQRLGELLLEN